MLNLIKIEWKRISIKNQFIGLIIANILIYIFVLMTGFMTSVGNELSDIPIMDNTLIMDLLVKSTFMVWQGVLIAGIIVEEYRSKTISVLFTYPINKKLLIMSKLLVVYIITLILIFSSSIIQNILVWQTSSFVPFLEYNITLEYIINTIITTLLTTIIGMFPFFVGMLQKSTVATVVSSIAVVSVCSSSNGQTGALLTMLPTAIAIAIISIVFVGFSINKTIKSDI